MSDPIDLDERRRRKQENLNRREADVYCCECGSGLFRLWSDGIIECVNCAGSMSGLWVAEEPEQ